MMQVAIRAEGKTNKASFEATASIKWGSI